MNRRHPCDCEICLQDRIVRRRAEVTQLYSERAPRLHVSPSVDRKAVALVALLFALALLGVAASWWVHT